MTIRVGVIGAGANTRLHHIPKLNAIDGVQVVAVANRSLESAQKVADRYNIPQATGSWRDIIENVDIDAVVIGTWPYLHHTLTLAALQAGKHVLCEARMAMNAKQAHEMLAESQKQPHLVAMVVPSPITFKYDATVADILRSGSLGSLLYIQVRSVGGAGPQGFPEASGSLMSWRQDSHLSGLNVMTLGIFYEALQRWIGDVSSVQATGKTVVGLRQDPESGSLRAVHIPDHLDLLATHPSGANVHFLISNVLGACQGLKSGFVLYGSHGTMELDLTRQALRLQLKGEEGAEPKLLEIAEEKVGRWRVEEEFAEAIRGTSKVTTTDFTKGVHYMEFTEAVSRALHSGRTVGLPLTPL